MLSIEQGGTGHTPLAKAVGHGHAHLRDAVQQDHFTAGLRGAKHRQAAVAGEQISGLTGVVLQAVNACCKRRCLVQRHILDGTGGAQIPGRIEQAGRQGIDTFRQSAGQADPDHTFKDLGLGQDHTAQHLRALQQLQGVTGHGLGVVQADRETWQQLARDLIGAGNARVICRQQSGRRTCRGRCCVHHQVQHRRIRAAQRHAGAVHHTHQGVQAIGQVSQRLHGYRGLNRRVKARLQSGAAQQHPDIACGAGVGLPQLHHITGQQVSACDFGRVNLQRHHGPFDLCTVIACRATAVVTVVQVRGAGGVRHTGVNLQIQGIGRQHRGARSVRQPRIQAVVAICQRRSHTQLQSHHACGDLLCRQADFDPHLACRIHQRQHVTGTGTAARTIRQHDLHPRCVHRCSVVHVAQTQVICCDQIGHARRRQGRGQHVHRMGHGRAVARHIGDHQADAAP